MNPYIKGKPTKEEEEDHWLDGQWWWMPVLLITFFVGAVTGITALTFISYVINNFTLYL
jgi:cytochrome bd-type quinol oxidase subunit 1